MHDLLEKLVLVDRDLHPFSKHEPVSQDRTRYRLDVIRGHLQVTIEKRERSGNRLKMEVDAG